VLEYKIKTKVVENSIRKLLYYTTTWETLVWSRDFRHTTHLKKWK